VDGLSTSNERARGVAFEQVGAYLLGLAFSSPTPLSDVFKFVGDKELNGQKAQLVAIHKHDGNFVFNPVNILSTEPTASYVLGYSPHTREETLAWLNDPQQTVFCFPANAVGPDLILVLGLPDKTLIRVVIQFKTEEIIGPIKTANAFRPMDPGQLTSQQFRPSTQDAVPSQAERGKQKRCDLLLIHFSPSHILRQRKQALRRGLHFEPRPSGRSRSLGSGKRKIRRPTRSRFPPCYS
jgi:hypothetical protein